MEFNCVEKLNFSQKRHFLEHIKIVLFGKWVLLIATFLCKLLKLSRNTVFLIKNTYIFQICIMRFKQREFCYRLKLYLNVGENTKIFTKYFIL